MSSPFQKLFSRKKAELIKPETGMLVPRDGTKLQKAIHSDHDNLSDKEIREANREYKKSVRKYNRKNDTNLAKKPPKKDTSLAPKMEQEVDEDARADANPGYTQWRYDTRKATKKEVPDDEKSLKKFKKWKAAKKANKKEIDNPKPKDNKKN